MSVISAISRTSMESGPCLARQARASIAYPVVREKLVTACVSDFPKLQDAQVVGAFEDGGVRAMLETHAAAHLIH